MSDRINLLKRMESLEMSPQFDGISKLICNVDDETQIVVGDDSGYALEFYNPLMTHEILSQMLIRATGYQYQPYSAKEALLDPAAEMGDAISAKKLYGGLYQRSRDFTNLMTADIGAPTDEEIDHEYKFETPQERKIRRQFGDVKATFAIQAGLIEARVSKTSPEGQTSFSWALDDTSHKWYANGNEVMSVSASGLKVKGRIEATSGYIGNGTSGFTISARALYNGMTSLGDTSHNGVYVGVDGISLGKGKFKVDAYGNLTATSGTFTGSVRAGSIQFGGSNGTFSAAGLTDYSIGANKYAGGSVVENAIGGGAVTNRKIGNSAVSYGKVDFTETLDQVGVNKSNIEAINGYFTGTANFNYAIIRVLQAQAVTLGGHPLYYSNGYVRYSQ